MVVVFIKYPAGIYGTRMCSLSPGLMALLHLNTLEIPRTAIGVSAPGVISKLQPSVFEWQYEHDIEEQHRPTRPPTECYSPMNLPEGIFMKQERGARDFRQTFAAARPLFLIFQRLARKLGLELTFARVTGILDAELYWPFYHAWRSPAWHDRLRLDDRRSLLAPEARYILYTNAADALARCLGQVAECGVYKGGTAYLLAELAKQYGRELFLFDTFAGMPETNPLKDLHRKGDFSDTSVDLVQIYLSPFDNIRFFPGFLPSTLESVADSLFAFVHVDLDIYDAILSVTQFFYPRLASGAVLIYDDYGFSSCPGARAAVDEFFVDKPEIVQALSSGQCLVRKL